MQEENLDYEGIVDVSVLVPSCFDNPLKEYSIAFLQDALLSRRRVLLPVSAVIGAYHITTRYLGVPRVLVKSTLSDLLETKSEALYGDISAEHASSALEYATAFNVESWDGYLISLAVRFDAKVIFSLDEVLGDHLKAQKDPGVPAVANPFPSSKVREYHELLKK